MLCVDPKGMCRGRFEKQTSWRTIPMADNLPVSEITVLFRKDAVFTCVFLLLHSLLGNSEVSSRKGSKRRRCLIICFLDPKLLVFPSLLALTILLFLSHTKGKKLHTTLKSFLQWGRARIINMHTDICLRTSNIKLKALALSSGETSNHN